MDGTTARLTGIFSCRSDLQYMGFIWHLLMCHLRCHLHHLSLVRLLVPSQLGWLLLGGLQSGSLLAELLVTHTCAHYKCRWLMSPGSPFSLGKQEPGVKVWLPCLEAGLETGVLHSWVLPKEASRGRVLLCDCESILTAWDLSPLLLLLTPD